MVIHVFCFIFIVPEAPALAIRIIGIATTACSGEMDISTLVINVGTGCGQMLFKLQGLNFRVGDKICFLFHYSRLLVNNHFFTIDDVNTLGQAGCSDAHKLSIEVVDAGVGRCRRVVSSHIVYGCSLTND